MPVPPSPSPAGCAPAKPSIAAGAACPRRSSPSWSAAKAFPPSPSTRQHGLWDTASMLAGDRPGAPGRRAPIVRIPLGDFATVEPRARFRRRRHHRADDQHAGGRARLCLVRKIPADRRAQLGPASRDHARQHAGPEGLSARGQRPHRHLRDDRDAHRARQPRGHRGNARHRCAVPRPGRPLDRAQRRRRCRSACPARSTASSTALPRPPARPARSWAPTATRAERAVALATRGVRFLAVGSDMGFLRAGAAAALKVLKG